MMNIKGYSLTELLVALAVSSLVIVSGMGIYMTTYSRYRYFEARSILVQDMMLINDFMRTELQNAGGGSIRAWSSLWVEDNCGARLFMPNCQGSDRLTVVTAHHPPQECQISAMPGPNTAEFWSGGICCITADFEDKQAMLVKGDSFSQRYIDSVDTTSCRALLQPGQAAANDSFPATINWTGGTLSRADVQTFFLDRTNHSLQRFSDLNNNGNADAGEVLLLADQIYDFQVALGFDADPNDGIVTETGDATDEWLYNAPGVAEALGAGALLNVRVNHMRMVSFGFVLGARAVGMSGADASESAQVLNGPLRTENGVFLQTSTPKLMLRNLNIFR